MSARREGGEHRQRRRRVAVLAVALVSTAVYLAALAPSVPASSPAPIRWRIVTLPVASQAQYSYAEPGLAIGPGGDVFADAATANTGAPPTFWLSRNQGQTWNTGKDFDPTGTSTGDADAAIGPDGYLYALNLGYANPPAQPSNPTVLVFRSPDGRAWSGPGSFPPEHGMDQPDRPWLVVNPFQPGNVDVVNSEVGGNIVIWRSFDHAATFSGPYPVTGGANAQAALALSSRPLFDPTRPGRLFMLYETAGPSATPTSSPAAPLYEFRLTQLWLASSTDGGLAWTNRLVLDTGTLPGPLHDGTLGHLLVASAIDGAGRLYAALSLRQATGKQTTIYFTHSRDHGATWSAPSVIKAPTRSNVMPALAITRSGIAYLSWYGSSDPDFTAGSARWSEMFAQAADPLAAHPAFTVGQVSDTGPVHIGGVDTAGAIGSDLGASWGLRDFQSIAVDACSQPHLIWAVDNGVPSTQTAVPLRGLTSCQTGGTIDRP